LPETDLEKSDSRTSMTEWWRPTFQITVDAFYRGDLDAGRDACEKLLSIDALPEHTELATRRNAIFYMPRLAEIAPSTAVIPIQFPVEPRWTRLNPSIAANPEGDGFTMVVRSSNFTLSWDWDYSVIDGSHVIRTTNYLADLSSQLELRAVRAIDDLAFRPDPPLYPVSGFEDCRLFWRAGTWQATATVRDRGARGKSRIALLELDGARVISERLLSPDAPEHEKNWMPILPTDEGPLRLVYGCFPTVVLADCPSEERMEPESIEPAPLVARDFRGGSQVIPFDGGHLCLVHGAVHFEDRNRSYWHRWVWFDDEWRLARLSRPFTFEGRGVDFAAGLAVRGDELVISYGRWDRDAFLATLRQDEVRALLAPPLDPGQVEAELRAFATAQNAVAELAKPAAEGVSERSAELEPDGMTPAATGRAGIVSTTLSGNARDIIADALRSVVDWVDWCLVIDTGITDDTLEIARQIAGEKLVIREFPWQDDFSAARNFALAAAAELGAAWAVTLDTDERIESRGVDLRTALETRDADSLRVAKATGYYAKERFFRLPARGEWSGPTHEAYLRGDGETDLLADVVFAELPKSDEEYRRKAERDVAILARHTAEHPDDPRWFYYLGDSLAGLERHEEAIAAFRICADLRGWDEEAAWAMYRAGQSYLRLDRPLDAVDAYAHGMARHAGLAELPWMAAYASWQAGNPAQAAWWARVAIPMGHFAGHGAAVPRINFRHLPGLWEGPYDVLRFALRALGDDAGADEAERLYHEAIAAREAAESPSPSAEGREPTGRRLG
jgi:hypothetical protein